MNWYEKCSVSEDSFIKEAGLEDWFKGIFTPSFSKDSIVSNLSMYAIIMLLSGSPLASVEAWADNAASKSQIDPQTIRETVKKVPVINLNQFKSMTNEQKKAYINSVKNKVKIVSKTSMATQPVQKTDKTPSNVIGLDSIVNAVIKHEGLLPFQTPFRITSKEMRTWGKIHGYEIDWDKNKNAEKGRQNFIFLKNKEEVFPAVKTQLEKYRDNPTKYGLKKNATLAETLALFDQSGVSGKIKAMKKELPNLDEKALMSSFK